MLEVLDTNLWKTLLNCCANIHLAQAVELDLPDDELLVEIEEEILISLPYDLREYLLQASDIVCGQVEPVTVTDSRSHTYLPELTSRAWSEGMPRELIVVCEYNGGYAHIAQDGTIGFWSINEGETTKSWETFWHWAQEEWLP